MEKSRDAAKRRREQERLRRETEKARCIYCGKKVTLEDRCSDGNYLHRECGYASAQR